MTACVCRICLCVQVDLHPSGKVMMAVQYLLEGVDTGKAHEMETLHLSYVLQAGTEFYWEL